MIQLQEENENISMPFHQRAMKGHIIIYPQRPDKIACMLPPSVEDIIMPICVIFIGSSLPSPEWLCKKAKPLSVRQEKVLLYGSRNIICITMISLLIMIF
jgi:hypothetical protein